MIGEDAVLSGGEQQRVSIARALLTDAPVLVLDEAASFAAPDSEVAVQTAIAALCRSRTVLVIAHRLRSVTGADQIIVLDGGRVVDAGRHPQLLSHGGLYARLWDAGHNDPGGGAGHLAAGRVAKLSSGQSARGGLVVIRTLLRVIDPALVRMLAWQRADAIALGAMLGLTLPLARALLAGREHGHHAVWVWLIVVLAATAGYTLVHHLSLRAALRSGADNLPGAAPAHRRSPDHPAAGLVHDGPDRVAVGAAQPGSQRDHGYRRPLGPARRSRGSLDRIAAILGTRPLPEPERPHSPDGNGITFDDVYFGYQPGLPVLHAVSAELRPGTMTALVGPSGAGKTTLACLTGWPAQLGGHGRRSAVRSSGVPAGRRR